jgi:hypothetical protein
MGDVLAKMQLPIKASSQIFEGAMVCALTASGYAVRAGTASTGPVLGIANAGAAIPTNDGDDNVDLIEGIFIRPCDATHPPVQADVGKPIYAKDDFTVSDLSSDGPLAGVLLGFEDSSGDAIFLCNAAVNVALAQEAIPATSVTGALSTVADAPAKAVLTSIIAALVAHGIGVNNTA